ncbi:hypothetical protein V8E54_006366 [Elaphomyces granulatus]
MPEPLSEDRFRAIVADAVAAAFARNISSQGPQDHLDPRGTRRNPATAMAIMEEMATPAATGALRT